MKAEVVMRKNEIYDRLVLQNQEHLLRFTNELSEEQNNALFSQLENLDYSVLNSDVAIQNRGIFSPMDALTIDEIKSRKDEFEAIGIKAIQEGKLGAVLLAGGQGTRLGFEHPKGMFNIGESKTLYIFECLINNLLKVVKKADAWIPLFVMTSEENDLETQKFFAEHDYFGYSEANILFFVQDQLPTVDTEGKLMLSAKDKVSTAPNGNGGWYMSLIKSGVANAIKNARIEWLNVFAVDNVLQKMADPCFLGAVIACNADSGSKVVAKADPHERVGVLCHEDGKPSIVEYYEMTDEMIESHEPDGRLSYNYGVILNYLFKTDILNKIVDKELPLHKAFKKVKYIDENGNIVFPSVNNAYKFETLVLDMVKLQDSCLAFEVERDKEFAPIKNKTGVDSVDTARELLKKNNIEI